MSGIGSKKYSNTPSNNSGRHSRHHSSSSSNSASGISPETLGYSPSLVHGYTLISELGRGSFAIVFLARAAGKRSNAPNFAVSQKEQTVSSFRSLSGLLKLSSSSLSNTAVIANDVNEPNGKDFAAIKVVSKEKLNKKLTENLESEIAILRRVRHENVVNLLNIEETPQYMCLVMEYCSWHDLAMYIKRRGLIDPIFENSHVNAQSVATRTQSELTSSSGSTKSSASAINLRIHQALLGALGLVENPLAGPLGGLAEFVVRNFCKQIAGALAFLRAHHMIHRDLKPQNILLLPPSGWGKLPHVGCENYKTVVAQYLCKNLPRLKIADFGFARVLPQQSLASTLCGSPLYMAPEILRYEKYDAKADLWSLGAVIYECVTGKVPYRAQNHVELLQKIEKRPPRFPDDAARLQFAANQGSSRSRLLQQASQPSGGLIPSLWQLSPPNIATSIGSPSSVASSPFLAAAGPLNGRANSGAYSTISDDLRGLIKGLLRKNPIERLGFEEVFQHPCVNIDTASHESSGSDAGGTPIPAAKSQQASASSASSSVSSSTGSASQRMFKGTRKAQLDEETFQFSRHSRQTSVYALDEDQGDHPLVPGISALQFDDEGEAGYLQIPFPEYKADLEAFMEVVSAGEPASGAAKINSVGFYLNDDAEKLDEDFVMISSQKLQKSTLEDEDANWPGPNTDVILEINSIVSQGWSLQQFLQKLPSLISAKHVLYKLSNEEQELRLLVLHLILRIYRRALRRLEIVSKKSGGGSLGSAVVDSSRLTQLSLWLQHNADKCSAQLDALREHQNGALTVNNVRQSQSVIDKLLTFSKIAATQELAILRQVNLLKPQRDQDALAGCIKELKHLQQLYKMLALVMESVSSQPAAVSASKLQLSHFNTALQTRIVNIDKQVEQLCRILGVNPS